MTKKNNALTISFLLSLILVCHVQSARAVDTISTPQEFTRKVTKNSKLTVVKFSASWCGPCQKMKPVFEEVAKENTDCDCVEVDIDGTRSIVNLWNISSVPTIVVVKDGKEVARLVGMQSKEAINKKITEAKNA
jgi:thioredoxin